MWDLDQLSLSALTKSNTHIALFGLSAYPWIKIWLPKPLIACTLICEMCKCATLIRAAAAAAALDGSLA